jgi:hypothetical protein
MKRGRLTQHFLVRRSDGCRRAAQIPGGEEDENLIIMLRKLMNVPKLPS